MNRLTYLQQLQALLFQLQILLAQKQAPQGLNNREKLYYAAKAALGTDASPNDLVPDEVGCVESIACIYRKCFGYGLGEEFSTYRLYQVLRNSSLWTIVTTPMRGDLVLSPTGYGNGSIPGHTGILGDNNIIYSNDSATGLFSTKYHINDWQLRYQQRGNFPVLFFRRV
jgi:hypothetical protein